MFAEAFNVLHDSNALVKSIKNKKRIVTPETIESLKFPQIVKVQSEAENYQNSVVTASNSAAMRLDALERRTISDSNGLVKSSVKGFIDDSGTRAQALVALDYYRFSFVNNLTTNMSLSFSCVFIVVAVCCCCFFIVEFSVILFE